MPGGALDTVHVQITLEEELLCAEFGGTISRNQVGHFRARNASAPVACAASVCGNGEQEFGEACDDGNTHELDSCTIGACEPAPDHLMTFDAQDGSVLWSDDIGSSWSHVAVANGVVFAGTNGAAELYAYDAVTGARLATLGLPTATASRAAVDGRSLYIGYGLGGPGGIRAFILPWQRLRLAVEPGAVERSYSEPMGAVLAGEMT